MRQLRESLRQLLGRAPSAPAPEHISPAAREIHASHAVRRDAEELAHARADRKRQAEAPKVWRRRRWLVLIAVNLLFVVSYRLDIQILEGTLTTSRFLGFHMADIFAALQVMLASRIVMINLVIGMATITLLCLVGGRLFCAWICPYHLLSEWAEIIHLRLARRKWIKNRLYDRRARPWLWVAFSALAALSGYTIYETISPTGIVSRALIYGPGLALVWIGALLLFEILHSRRAWCKYVCPIGLTYGIVGAAAPIKVTYTLESCFHDGACRQVCLVPHVLHVTRKGHAEKAVLDLGADCTRCGACVDVCPTNSLNFTLKGLGKGR